METLTPTLTPADRFHSLIDGLFSDITTKVANGCVDWPLNIPLLALIWRRLRRIRRRFEAILAQMHAGTLPQAGTLPAADGDAPRPGAVASPLRRSGLEAQARRFGWVIYAVSWFVNMRHFELQEMLEDPATEALVAKAPQLGGVLRPLCQMVAVKPPDWLRRPRRRPVKPPVPPAPEWLVKQPGAELRPDGTVWMRLGGSLHWRPWYPETLEQAQKFDYPVKVWPRRE